MSISEKLSEKAANILCPTEAYLGLFQPSMMELFYGKSRGPS